MIGGIVMAAGLSRRFQDGDKLLTKIEGESLAEITARKVCSSKVDGITFVYSSNEVLEMIEKGIRRGNKDEKAIVKCLNDDPEIGQSQSIRLGMLSFVEYEKFEGIMFFTSDQPGIRVATIDMMVDLFKSLNDKNAIIIPMAKGRRGSPVLFGKNYFSELLLLEGDNGGKGTISKNEKNVSFIEVDEAELFDIDTESALREFTGRK